MIYIVRLGELNFLKKKRHLNVLKVVNGKSYMEIRFFRVKHTIGQLELIKILKKNLPI